MGLSRSDLLARDAEIRAGASDLLTSLKRCRSEAFAPCTDREAQSVAQKLADGRIQAARHLVLLLWDAFDREAPLAALEGVGRAIIHTARAWYAKRDAGERVEMPVLVHDVLDVSQRATVSMVRLLHDSSEKARRDAHDDLARLIADIESADARLVA